MSRPVRLTASGNVGGSGGGMIKKVVLTPAAAVATLQLLELGSGGTPIADFQAAANGNSVTIDMTDNAEGGLVYAGQLYATITGAGALVMVAL